MPRHTLPCAHAKAPRQLNDYRAPVLTSLAVLAAGSLAWYAMRRPSIPSTAIPVSSFDLPRYMGKWYEVARIDNRWEKGLQRTQAEYTLTPSGRVLVENRGYDPRKREWHVARGRAKAVMGADVAALKVSFFGPFYDGYNVVALDPQYQWAMVVGSDLEKVWILSRSPFLATGVEERLLRHAAEMGVPIDRILWVHQDGVNPTGSY